MTSSNAASRTSKDYWSLPDGERAELIGGVLYPIDFPNRRHQEIVGGISCACDQNWVEPDVLVVCEPAKLTDRGCEGAPDFIAEVVSPSSRKRDYALKMCLYEDAGVREY